MTHGAGGVPADDRRHEPRRERRDEQDDRAGAPRTRRAGTGVRAPGGTHPRPPTAAGRRPTAACSGIREPIADAVHGQDVARTRRARARSCGGGSSRARRSRGRRNRSSTPCSASWSCPRVNTRPGSRTSVASSWNSVGVRSTAVPRTCTRILGTSTSTSAGAQDLGADHGAARSAQHRSHPRHELLRAERLHQVVVGAELQADDPVGLLAPRGEHDDRRAGRAPELARDVEAVHAGQTRGRARPGRGRSPRSARDAPPSRRRRPSPRTRPPRGSRAALRAICMSSSTTRIRCIARASRDGRGGGNPPPPVARPQAAGGAGAVGGSPCCWRCHSPAFSSKRLRPSSFHGPGPSSTVAPAAGAPHDPADQEDEAEEEQREQEEPGEEERPSLVDDVDDLHRLTVLLRDLDLLACPGRCRCAARVVRGDPDPDPRQDHEHQCDRCEPSTHRVTSLSRVCIHVAAEM